MCTPKGPVQSCPRNETVVPNEQSIVSVRLICKYHPGKIIHIITINVNTCGEYGPDRETYRKDRGGTKRNDNYLPQQNRVLPKSKKDVILLPGMSNYFEKTGTEPVNTVSTVCRGSITSRPSIWSLIFQRSCFVCSEG